ncbi:MAG: hypothetical protein KatS3mg096_703 [Candidatus Parcubacteria bacterium]|nr:MAG: hypothetical protein KatS3mg096_676 [Candidatus Parcubacteria bacterium]GIW67835.1 MAG: hypothetical protein KatS3mg096_703 [Candidatus Parcubacteria bacterium]
MTDYLGDSSSLVESQFNMILKTLYDLREIASHIERLYAQINISDEIKQKIKIHLVKSFFVNSSPLLNENFVNSLKDQILSLRPKTIKVLDKDNPTSEPTFKLIFDYELEKELDEMLIKIHRQLQKEGYYGSKRDLGRIIGRF